MAAAHARLRNEPGVCIISRGPGAMNTAIALHVAYHDAEPVVFLVGQADLDELGRMTLQEMNYSKTFSDTAKMVIEVVHSSQVSAETKVVAQPEREMPCSLSLDVEAVGVGKDRRVTVGGGNAEQDHGFRGKLFASEFAAFGGHARQQRGGRLPPQRFLDGTCLTFRVIAQALHLSRLLEQANHQGTQGQESSIRAGREQ